MSRLVDTMRASQSVGAPPAIKKNPAMAFLSPPVRIRPNILDECGHTNSGAAEKKHRKRGGKGQARPAASSCFPEGGIGTAANPSCNKDTASSIASLLATAKAVSLTDEVPLKGIILANRRSVFHKTRMCPRQRNRSCPLGDSCTFAHSEEELRPPPVLDRTRLCPSVLTSGAPCPRANGEQCRFAHSKAEIRHTANMFKTNMCLKWNRGKCKAGEGCNHAHGEEELRFYRLLAHANGSRDFRSEAEAGALRALRGAADQSKGGQQRLQALLLQAVGQSPKGGDAPSRRKGRRGANSSLSQRKPMVSNASKLLPSGRSNMPHASTLSSDEDQEEPTMFREVPISPEYLLHGLAASGSGGLPLAGAEAGDVSSQGEEFFKLLIGLAPHAPELVLSVLAQHLAEGLPLLNSQQTQAVASALAGSAKPRLNVPLSKPAAFSSANNTATSTCGPVHLPGTVRDSSAIHEAGRGGKGIVQGMSMPGPCCNVGPPDECQEDEYAQERATLYALGRAGLMEGGSASPVSLSPALSGLGSVGLGHYLNNGVASGRTAGSGTPDSSSTCASLEESADRLGSLLKVSMLLDDETRQGSLSPLPAALTPPDAGELVRDSRAEVGVRGEGDFGGKKRVSLPYMLTPEEMEMYLETNDVNSFAVASSVDRLLSNSFMSLCRALRGDDGDGFGQEMESSAPLFCPSIQSEEFAAQATDKQGGGRSGHTHERGGVSLQEAVTLLQSLGLVDCGRRSTRGDQ